ncbi:MAG: hypothetical protein K8L97_34615 [Anaerolineae bacterium]|nr:hypothetical protein [Anaerolineae bacterium]
MTDEKASIFFRLRRLQEQNRSDIPGVMMQKNMSAFTLHEDAAPEPPRSTVSVVVHPQDPFVSEPAVRQMNAADIAPGLVNTRFQLRDSVVKPAKPDAQGNYLYWPGTPEFDQINSFYYATFTLRMYERYAHRTLSWSFPAARLLIDPHAGDGANAFYSEQDRLLGFHSFQVENEFIYAAQSADVVSHETAHAILDGVRDLYNESFGLGSAAFHESFGDMTAVLVALHDDSLVRRLLEWTKGNLRLVNFISVVADQITERLRQRGQEMPGRTVYLRNALNDLKSLPFDQLPNIPSNPEVELGREIHNYSRLFTGAFYDILVGIYESLRKSMEDRMAIHSTRDIVGHILIGAVELGPVGEMDFVDMARAFLAADSVLYDGKHTSILQQVFDERGLFSKADSEAFLALLKGLPDVRAPEIIDSAVDAALFLEQKIAPVLSIPADLTPMNAYRNAAGSTFITYFNHRRTTLSGSLYHEFAGSHLDAFGGLTLAFDATGRLRSVCLRPVTDEDIRQIHILTADLIAAGAIVASGGGQLTSAQSLYNQPDNPVGLWLANPPLLDAPLASGRAKLVKYPVIFDHLPGHITNGLQYLAAWRRKLLL